MEKEFMQFMENQKKAEENLKTTFIKKFLIPKQVSTTESH